MSRNLSMLEKALVLILIMGGILGAGGYFLAYPAYQKIGVQENKIEAMKAQIREAEETRTQVGLLAAAYEAKRERAKNIHEGFYSEMTTTEAITKVQEILTGGKVEAVDGIAVSDIEEIKLSIQDRRRKDRDVRYELRKFAEMFINPIDEEEEKRASARPTQGLTEEELIHFTNEAFQSVEKVLAEKLFEGKELNELANLMHTLSPAILYKEILAIIQETGANAVDNETKLMLVDYLRILLYGEGDAGVGRITAKFEIHVKYEEYLAFLDYLNELPEITLITSCILWQEPKSPGDEVLAYQMSIDFLVVKPMDIPEPPVNPFAPAGAANAEVFENTETEEPSEE